MTETQVLWGAVGLTFLLFLLSFYQLIRWVEESRRQDAEDFCRYCGASLPPRDGEGTCEKCDPRGEST